MYSVLKMNASKLCTPKRMSDFCTRSISSIRIIDLSLVCFNDLKLNV